MLGFLALLEFEINYYYLCVHDCLFARGSSHCIKYHSCKVARTTTCADLGSFVRGGPNLIFFLVDERIEDPNIAINEPSSASQRNFAGGPMMTQH